MIVLVFGYNFLKHWGRVALTLDFDGQTIRQESSLPNNFIQDIEIWNLNAKSSVNNPNLNRIMVRRNSCSKESFRHGPFFRSSRLYSISHYRSFDFNKINHNSENFRWYKASEKSNIGFTCQISKDHQYHVTFCLYFFGQRIILNVWIRFNISRHRINLTTAARFWLIEL